MRLVPIVLLLAPLALSGQGGADQRPLRLSLKRAVELATSPEGAAQIQLSAEAVKQAQTRSLQARAALLPDLSASFADQSRTSNLGAMGIKFQSPIPGLSIPSFVGPFTTMDARATVQQSVFDFSSIRRYQASRAGLSAARSDADNTADQVAAQVARAYLAALKNGADVEAASANVALSEAILKLAENQKTAGTGTGIEITRAKVQLSNDRQRLLVAENDLRRARLRLLRVIGLRLETNLELTDKLEYVPVEAVALEQAKAAALKERRDLQAQKGREDNARLAASAVKLERLPSVAAFGDYGAIGTGFDNALPTRTYGIALRVPIFDGGRRDARRAESASVYRAEKVRTADLTEQIELDLRVSLDSLHSAESQVQVAREGLDLAQNELTQARRRLEAGIANSLEVTDAQTRLERARDNQNAALLNYNLARIDLAQATGTIRRTIQ